MLSSIDTTEAKSSFRFRVKSLPGVLVNWAWFRAMSRIVVFINFFNFAACELMMYPPCNELGLLFITRAVFSNALLKTAAHFCPLVKCFLLFSKETVKRKIPRTFLWYEVSFLSSYLNDIGREAGCFADVRSVLPEGHFTDLVLYQQKVMHDYLQSCTK